MKFFFASFKLSKKALSSIPTYFFKIIFALVFSFIITSYTFETIEMFFFDAREVIQEKLGLKKLKKTPIVLIYTDISTIERYQDYPDFKTHSLFLQKLKQVKNSNIIYLHRIEDGQFVDIKGDYESKFNFTNVAKSIDNLYVATNEMALPGQQNSLKLKVPLDNVKTYSAPRTKDLQLNIKNKISRRIVISYEGQQLLHHKISSEYNTAIIDKKNIHGLYEYIGTEQAYVNFSPAKSFPTFKFQDILSDQFDLNELSNKIILVGTNTNKYIEDYISTPYSSETADLIPLAELHANMFQTLISNNSPERTNKPVDIILTALTAFITIYAALSVKPSKGILILVSSFTFFIVISTLLLRYSNIWINLAHPLLTIFLCYYFFIPYRLILENRRSWEYFQKNKLLHQVEELKTNFISMMSHDLKTPIARIQGMTEVILKDDVTLSPIQREAVDTIKGSSDDLLKFINSILQYGRIESQGVELHKHSKDINQVLTDVIKKHEFLAKVKKIKVHTELEPMFPIQIDVELMKQVLSNLIENAIKYSHEESHVTVKSREEGSLVVIEIADNGVGIPAEDLPNIFMKFYRSHNVKTSTIKGTGLGLYLAKYFAELHKGDITVTSEVGKGSTFKLTLPA